MIRASSWLSGTQVDFRFPVDTIYSHIRKYEDKQTIDRLWLSQFCVIRSDFIFNVVETGVK